MIASRPAGKIPGRRWIASSLRASTSVRERPPATSSPPSASWSSPTIACAVGSPSPASSIRRDLHASLDRGPVGQRRHLAIELLVEVADRAGCSGVPSCGRTHWAGRRLLSPQRDLDLDLDRAATRQGGDAHRRPGMTAGVAEHLAQEPTGAVDHRGLLHEARRRRHEPEHGEHPFDAIEVAQLRPQHGEARSARTTAPPRRPRPLITSSPRTRGGRARRRGRGGAGPRCGRGRRGPRPRRGDRGADTGPGARSRGRRGVPARSGRGLVTGGSWPPPTPWCHLNEACVYSYAALATVAGEKGKRHMFGKARILLVGACLAGLVTLGVAPAVAQSSGDTPKATEIGVTAKEIRIAVIADVDNPFAPGPVQGRGRRREGRGEVHQQQGGRGGIAGRKLVVDFIDSHLNANEPATASSPRARTTSRWSATSCCSSATSTTRSSAPTRRARPPASPTWRSWRPGCRRRARRWRSR